MSNKSRSRTVRESYLQAHLVAPNTDRSGPRRTAPKSSLFAQVSEQNNRWFYADAVMTNDEVFVRRLGSDDLDVGLRKPG